MGHTRHTATLTNQARSSEPLGTGKRHRAISLISKCPVPPTCLAAAVLHDFHVQVPPDTDGDASQLPLHYLRSLHPGPTNPSKLTWSGRSHRPRVPSCRCRCVACKSTTAGNNRLHPGTCRPPIPQVRKIFLETGIPPLHVAPQQPAFSSLPVHCILDLVGVVVILSSMPEALEGCD